MVVRALKEAHNEWRAGGGQGVGLAGSSNVCSPSPHLVSSADPQVYLALKYGLQPAGTIAHEWIMAIGATYGYSGANGRAMDMWEEGMYIHPRGLRAR